MDESAVEHPIASLSFPLLCLFLVEAAMYQSTNKTLNKKSTFPTCLTPGSGRSRPSGQACTNGHHQERLQESHIMPAGRHPRPSLPSLLPTECSGGWRRSSHSGLSRNSTEPPPRDREPTVLPARLGKKFSISFKPALCGFSTT